MKVELTVKDGPNLLGLRFSKRLTRSAKDALACWGFRWNPVARFYTATRTAAREAAARLIESGNYPGFA